MNVSINKRARRLAMLLAGLLAALLLALPVAAAPQVNKTSPVNDYAGILSDSTIQYVTEVSAALQSTCGAEIGVYTTEYIGNSTMEGYAYSVLNEWGLGSVDKDNGVLLLLAPGEDDYYITRGTGLESALSISTLSTILDDKLEPNWVNGDYDTGVHDTVAAIADKLCSIYGVSLDTSTVSDTTSGRNGGSNIMSYIMILIAVILIIWVISTLTRPRPPRGGGPRGGVGRDMFWYSMGRASRRPRRPPPPPPPRSGPGYGGPRGGGPRPSGGGYRTGGGMGGFGGAGRSGGSRPSRPSGGFRPSGGYHTGGGSSRGGGVGRHH
ncbi:MAG: TPM domain-containing protein [Gemmiger sp.]|uniref:TPM domain-containing protein n=1 Tax=Gemmiger sp. TaxID=2049027 RepID=UPI002A9157A1|nr:TPM domain-containing protein [Gemmiger sp.]MCI6383796.1 TPM domain-containing protein [Subdoligranulum variabile]MDY5203442.1 TPM domain-containing protein [Gemmiger sp.]